MVDTTPVVVESQLDWLTAAAHHKAEAQELHARAESWLRAEIDRGQKVQPFRTERYVGYMAGRVRIGTLGSAVLVQLSGDLAPICFDSVWPLRSTVSRLDLAVTVRTPEPDPRPGWALYAEGCDYKAVKGTAPAVELRAKDDGGCTTYIGTRGSAYFLRCYDKHAECLHEKDDDGAAHYQNCWRYELECGSVQAVKVAKAYSDQTDRSAWVGGYVAEWMKAHKLTPLWNDVNPTALVPGFRRRSDLDSRTRWLQKSVRPTIEWMRQHRTRAELLEILGLADQADESA